MAELLPSEMILDQEVVSAEITVLESLPEGWEPQANTAIPVDDWLRLLADGADLKGVGVVVFGDSDIEALRAHLERVPVVALSFPHFKDGRAYSHARRLRAHWGFEGLLLAFGDVQRDQLVNMSRCGINGFYLRGDQDLYESLKAFGTYSQFYQYA